ncbi:MAG: hypothetical protein AB2L11_00310 [Syntrophobacteraceae bacterium]
MGIRFKYFTLGLTLLLVMLGSADPARVQGEETDISATVREAEAAGVPQITLSRLLALGYEHQFDPTEVKKLLRVLIATQKDGVPLQPFVNKIEEGVAKRIAPSRIVQVLEKKQDDYRFTLSLIAARQEGQTTHDPAASGESHVRLAELLNAGLTREDLQQLSASAPSAPLPVMIRGGELLATLKQAHFDSGLAGQLVSSGLQNNYFTADHADFGRIVATAKRKGIPDAEIANAALSVIQSNASVNRLSSVLGVSAADLEARGPQVGEARSGSSGSGMGPGQGSMGPSSIRHGGTAGSAGGIGSSGIGGGRGAGGGGSRGGGGRSGR